MRVRVFATAREAASSLADRMVSALAAEPDLVLGLPTGRTPIDLYRELVARYRRGEVTFSRATTFNLDEFVGIGPSHPGSYRAYMERHLFRHIDVPRGRIHFLDGAGADLEAECARFERVIENAGGIGLQVLGIGGNGHIGFNEPGSSLTARTHRATLAPETRRANAGSFGGDPLRVPVEALSMGMATIFQARTILLLATGRAKARMVARMIDGPITTRVPASLLQLHSDVEVFLDEAAAGLTPPSAVS